MKRTTRGPLTPEERATYASVAKHGKRKGAAKACLGLDDALKEAESRLARIREVLTRAAVVSADDERAMMIDRFCEIARACGLEKIA